MLLELLYELLGEMSPMYFYLGIVFSIICSSRFMYKGFHNSLMNNYVYTRKRHALHFKLLPKQEQLGAIIEVRNWITHTTKRIDAPDDDTDNQSFSITNINKKRGGQQCKGILYSLSLENIASSQ
ncbi:hypothetical protein [Virgibacillus salinus]|uniref:Uncharacterized protein n=1 Tax=Virgibacillus salinus TaxID=553311 RepID=A0A1H1DJI6_9BACI|nr:hypothetical protein [Virgibacillus salinus]SDQ76654.1 hypothetical protein SAMN05216231_2447 [Virgibacillus salinus]